MRPERALAVGRVISPIAAGGAAGAFYGILIVPNPVGQRPPRNSCAIRIGQECASSVSSRCSTRGRSGLFREERL